MIDTKSFGFVTGCHEGDLAFVQATLASISHYCPGIPICLVVDGSCEVGPLVRQYSLQVVRIADLPSAQMRRLISGNYRAKLAAMWAGPFEHYVWLDSDAIVWGNFLDQLDESLDFQIFGKPPTVNATDGRIPWEMIHYQFDPTVLQRFDPHFQWENQPYFCAGAYACRRNVISFERWLAAEAWNEAVPGGLFRFGDMGLLNYLVHSMAQRGEARVGIADLQDLWVDSGIVEFERDCRGSGWRFPASIPRPRVAHFCGRKPFLFDRRSYSRPFTIARLEHHLRDKGALGAWLAVLDEERTFFVEKARRRVKRWFRR